MTISITRLPFIVLSFLTTIIFRPDLASARAETTEKIEMAADQIPYRFENVSRTVFISDIHGDMKALVRILTSKKLALMDRKGNWTGGHTKLVINGDLIDGSPDSELLLDYIYGRLRQRIYDGGGSLVMIIGNHELMAVGGNEKHMTKAERDLFARADGDTNMSDFHEISDDVRSMFRAANGRYAENLRDENFLSVVNRSLIVHAGLVRPMLEMARAKMRPSDINVIGRRYLRYFQGLEPKPGDQFDWIVDLAEDDDEDFQSEDFTQKTGPVSDRTYKITNGKGSQDKPKAGLSRRELKELLDWFDVDHIIIGHTPTPDKRIALKHPYYRDMVISIDTHRAEVFGGNVTALEMTLEKNGRSRFKVYNFKRRPHDKKVEEIRQRQKQKSLDGAVSCLDIF